MTSITLLCGVLSALSLGHSISVNGLINKGLYNHVLYGSDASIKDFPYFARLSNCGAGILSDSWIVTAAHCVVPLPTHSEKIVWVGGERIDNSKAQQYDTFIVHPKYIRHPIPMNDIALLRLVTPLTFNDKVKPLELPTKNSTRSPYLSFVGRGLDETNLSNAIKSVDLTRLTGEQCLSHMPKSDQKNLRPHLPMLEKAIVCTMRSDDLPGICFGDSGGPLTQGNTLIGIASFLGHGMSCHEKRLAFFTNVATYVPWIKEHTGL